MIHRHIIFSSVLSILFLVNASAWAAPKGNPGGEVPPDIDALADRVEVVEGDVANIQADLLTANSSIQDLQTDLGAAQADIATTQSNLTSLQGTVSSLDGELGTIDTRLIDLEDGYSAIAGSKVVFVTDDTYSGALGGLAGADEKCQTAADDAGLNGIYLAWLSTGPGLILGTPSIDPQSRFIRHNVPYIRTDGTKVADHYADLVDGTIDAPINHTEFGTQLFSMPDPVLFWSTTSANGEGLIPSLNDDEWTCENWTTDAMFTTAFYLGNIASTGFGWSAAGMSAPVLCGTPHHLLCVQQ